MKIKAKPQAGLNLLEVLVVIATVGILLVLLAPHRVGDSNKRKALRIHCLSNLKHIGLGALLWANDYGEQFPWLSTNSSGSLAFANSSQVFRHYAAMSNELVTPKLLTCPSDQHRIRTTNFARLSNTNLSYFVGLDANGSKPERLLSGDRNITGGVLSNGFLRLLRTNTPAGWTTALHNRAGNVALADGSVQQVTEQGLQMQLQRDGLPVIRLAIP